MKKVLLFFLCLLAINVESFTQCANDFNLTTQGAVDAFPASCTQVNGDIKISGSGITNLNGLSNVSSIVGELRISSTTNLSNLTGLGDLNSVQKLTISGNTSLNDISALGNLTSVSNSFSVGNNTNLTSLSGLVGLTNVGSLTITNPSLTSLSGLSSLTTITFSLRINGTGLTSLNGLNNLSSIGSRLTISSNSMLSSLGGISNLSSVGDDVAIQNNGSLLMDFSGLDGLTSIGGGLVVQSNGGLKNLNGLQNLNSIGNQITISSNSNLTSLNGINNIAPPTIERLVILANAQLSDCVVESVCNFLNIDPEKFRSISGNATGCNSDSEVQTACAAAGLPVSWLVPTTATIQNTQAHIHWSVAQQINNDLFLIEHSRDGRQFDVIGEVDGDGDYLPEKEFSFIHEAPNHGDNYYRVKQVDFDGAYEYSNTAHVHYGEANFSIFPNPVAGQLMVTTEQAGQLELFNQVGQLMLTRPLAEGNNEIDVSGLGSGIYFLKTSGGEVARVVKR